MVEGIYSIQFEEYEARPAASKHLLDALAVSPLHCWSYFLNPERTKQKETPAKALGSAIHVSILEPERFEKEYVQEPDKDEVQRDNPRKILDLAEDYKREAKALGLKSTGTKPELKKVLSEQVHNYYFWDELYDKLVAGRKVLSQHDWRVVKAITARVRKHPSASNLLSAGKAEQSIFWVDKDTGVQCKGRIDWLTPDSIILDLKSTTDASPEGFQRSISKYRYYVQAAMYTDGLQALGQLPPVFVFAAWEKSVPYASALYYATKEMLEEGRKEYKRLLKIYADCLSSDEWPGYSDSIEPINLPENFKSSSDSELDWLDEMENG